MFSSNQILEISGEFSQLEDTIRFVMKLYDNPKTVTYQITDDGKYCLGWNNKDGWKEYPFDFDAHIISEIVKQHLKKNKKESEWDYADGSTDAGFLMKVIPNVFSSEKDSIKYPFYGIVSIEYFTNYYAK